MAGEAHHLLGDLPQCLEMHFRALEINRNNRDKKGEAITMGYIGFAYVDLNEYRQALSYLNEARIIFEKFRTLLTVLLICRTLGVLMKE